MIHEKEKNAGYCALQPFQPVQNSWGDSEFRERHKLWLRVEDLPPTLDDRGRMAGCQNFFYPGTFMSKTSIGPCWCGEPAVTHKSGTLCCQTCKDLEQAFHFAANKRAGTAERNGRGLPEKTWELFNPEPIAGGSLEILEAMLRTATKKTYGKKYEKHPRAKHQLGKPH